jgi:hypothetical protein
LVWFGLVWFGLVWFGLLVWFGRGGSMSESDATQHGTERLVGFVWFGLVGFSFNASPGFGLVWFGLVWWAFLWFQSVKEYAVQSFGT